MVDPFTDKFGDLVLQDSLHILLHINRLIWSPEFWLLFLHGPESTGFSETSPCHSSGKVIHKNDVTTLGGGGIKKDPRLRNVVIVMRLQNSLNFGTSIVLFFRVREIHIYFFILQFRG